jgi:hypothetical protein
MSFPPVRRIVTCHNPSGQSIIESDKSLAPANPLDPQGSAPTGVIPGFTNLFKTTGHPATNVQGEWFDVYGKMIGLVDYSGVTGRIVDCMLLIPPFRPHLTRGGLQLSELYRVITLMINVEGDSPSTGRREG